MTKETIEVEAVHFPVSSADDLAGALDGYARVQGKAAAGDGYPVVRCDGFVVGVKDLAEWPDDVLGEVVMLRGRLIREGEQYLMEKSLYETV